MSFSEPFARFFADMQRDEYNSEPARRIRREQIAREALEEIAGRGAITVDAMAKVNTDADLPVCPQHGALSEPDVYCDCGKWRCGECGELQPNAGPCLNRECLTAIARKALDEMRGVP